MSIKITDGRGSAAHITSNDIVGKQQASLGTESCVYAVGNKFAYTLVDNNTIEIADGEGSIYGCFWRILPETVEEVTLTTGTQGVCRYDLIVARYTQDATGVESVSLAVLEGEEAASEEEAVAPGITEADIRDTVQTSEYALYKVFINGINVESVTSMMTVCHSLQTACK
ncbi:MAG: hypothetical protein LUE24_13990 [Lachnospiraceae bacterium]|nr:hypothetical protein [Lachnospiraceae bacterium]